MLSPRLSSLSVTFLGALLVAGCTMKQTQPAQPQAKPYVIGTGDIMVLNQEHHAKLWFAGHARNWPLAQYDLNQLREGFRHVKTWHPIYRNVATAPLIDEFVVRPLADLDKAVKGQDEAAFTTGFDDLSAGCNGCHKQLGAGFNVIQRPTAPEYTNQNFAPARPG